MSDQKLNLIAQLASMRDRTLFLRTGLEQYSGDCDGEIGSRLRNILSELTSIESALHGVSLPGASSVLRDQQVLDIAIAVSNKLGKSAFVITDGPMPIIPKKPQGKPA